MDLQYFLNILLRRKWLILTVAIVAAATALFFVHRADEKFKASAVMSTGIIDVTPDLSKETPWVQQFFVDMGLGKLQEFMTSQRNVVFLSYRLLAHDLDADTLGTDRPFRILDAETWAEIPFSTSEIEDFKYHIKGKVDSLKYTLDNPKMEHIFHDLSQAYGYDYENLMKNNIAISRKGETDLLTVEFISENPLLSAYATNQFCKDFLKNYQFVQQEDEVSSVGFLSDQMDEKKRQLDSLRGVIRIYQSSKNLADLEGQRNAAITQNREIENQLIEYKQKKKSLEKSIIEVKRYITDTRDQLDGDAGIVLVNNQAVSNMNKQIEKLQEKYFEGGMKDEKLAKQIEITQKNRDAAIERLAKATPDSEEDQVQQRLEKLLARKVDLEIDYNETIAGIEKTEDKLAQLSVSRGDFVYNEAYLKDLNQEVKLAEHQYELMFTEYSKEKLNFDNSILPVKIFEHAQIPEKSEPKMRAIISAFSGIVGGTLASVVIFLLAFLDYSVNTPHKFRKFTNLKLIESFNKIKTKNLNFNQLFNTNGENASLGHFKEAIRNLRYAIESQSGNVVLFSSTKPEEGKTFLILALAHAFRVKKKKVLLIDMNFKNNTLTRMSESGEVKNGMIAPRLIGDPNLEEGFEAQSTQAEYNLENVDIVGNKGSFQSPSEVFADKDFESFLNRARDNYDYIFMESAALNKYADTKELVNFSDIVISVFAAENEIKEADKDSIAYLKSLGTKFMGAVLNKVDIKNLKN